MSDHGKEEEPLYSAHSHFSLSTDWQDQEEAPVSPWVGPTMNFDLTPIFLDSDEELATEEIRPIACRTSFGWNQVPNREVNLVLGHSGLYVRRCARHRELGS